MKHIVILLLFFVIPTASLSETLRIRSGNHSDFARLVVYGVGSSEWTIENAEGGYELVIENSAIDFDYSSVFLRIPKDRLLGLDDQGSGRLFLSVECDCHIESFEIQQGLVIDILDGPPLINSPLISQSEGVPESVILATGPELGFDRENKESFSLPGLTRRSRLTRTDLVWDGQVSLTSPLNVSETLSVNKVLVNETDLLDEDTTLNRVAELENELITQIGRASIQGIVEAEIPSFETQVIQGMEAGNTTVETETLNVQEGDIPTLSNSSSDHVRFETAFDRGKPFYEGASETTLSGDSCMPDSWFDVANWGEQDGIENGFFIGRRSIVGEFDDIIDDELVKMIQKYIYLSFGAEANSLISAFEGEIKNEFVYRFLANIMDFGESKEIQIPVSQIECDSSVAFWAFLAYPEEIQAQDYSEDRVLETYSNLPLHLRRHLGPYLAKRFLSVGNTDLASEVVNILSRTASTVLPAQELVEAELNLQTGATATGIDGIEKVFRSSGPLAAEAAVRLVDESINNDVALPIEMNVVAASLAHESKGTSLGSELIRVKLRADANSGRIMDVLSDIDNLYSSGELSEDHVHVLISEVLDIALKESSDSEFVQAIAISEQNIKTENISLSLKQNIASRLLDIGFPKKAREILNSSESEKTEFEEVMLARSFLLERNALKAIDILDENESAEALKVRAEAENSLGSLAEAIRLFRLIDDEDAISSLQWELENFDYAIENELGAKNRLAELILNGQNDNAEVGISEGNKHIANSVNLRGIVTEIIERN